MAVEMAGTVEEEEEERELTSSIIEVRDRERVSSWEWRVSARE